jgi:hypothetical protein
MNLEPCSSKSWRLTRKRNKSAFVRSLSRRRRIRRATERTVHRTVARRDCRNDSEDLHHEVRTRGLECQSPTFPRGSLISMTATWRRGSAQHLLCLPPGYQSSRPCLHPLLTFLVFTRYSPSLSSPVTHLSTVKQDLQKRKLKQTKNEDENQQSANSRPVWRSQLTFIVRQKRREVAWPITDRSS